MNDVPLVSVIIPARNEEANIGLCLDSLVDQKGVDFEIMVVDDGSVDCTKSIAQGYPNVIVLTANNPPAGCTGKSNAISAAIPFTRGRWLLFTDADTRHRPGSLARSVAEAESHGVGLLSYSPKQDNESWWEKLIQPVVFSELSSAFDYDLVSDPSSETAAANGQYLLMARDVYTVVGGHAAVCKSLLEDVDLARRAKRYSPIRFRYAPDAVACRMYRSFAELRDGWTKNLALLFPNCRTLAVRRSLESVFLLVVPFCAGLLIRQNSIILGSCLAVSTMGAYYFFLRRLKRAGYGMSSIISAFGTPVFVYLLIRSLRHHLKGRVSWRGRMYPGQLHQP
jgi:glycosyltransferase involved in cell wall biosynthesis